MSAGAWEEDAALLQPSMEHRQPDLLGMSSTLHNQAPDMPPAPQSPPHTRMDAGQDYVSESEWTTHLRAIDEELAKAAQQLELQRQQLATPPSTTPASPARPSDEGDARNGTAAAIAADPHATDAPRTTHSSDGSPSTAPTAAAAAAATAAEPKAGKATAAAAAAAKPKRKLLPQGPQHSLAEFRHQCASSTRLQSRAIKSIASLARSNNAILTRLDRQQATQVEHLTTFVEGVRASDQWAREVQALREELAVAKSDLAGKDSAVTQLSRLLQGKDEQILKLTEERRFSDGLLRKKEADHKLLLDAFQEEHDKLKAQYDEARAENVTLRAKNRELLSAPPAPIMDIPTLPGRISGTGTHAEDAEASEAPERLSPAPSLGLAPTHSAKEPAHNVSWGVSELRKEILNSTVDSEQLALRVGKIVKQLQDSHAKEVSQLNAELKIVKAGLRQHEAASHAASSARPDQTHTTPSHQHHQLTHTPLSQQQQHQFKSSSAVHRSSDPSSVWGTPAGTWGTPVGSPRPAHRTSSGGAGAGAGSSFGSGVVPMLARAGTMPSSGGNRVQQRHSTGAEGHGGVAGEEAPGNGSGGGGAAAAQELQAELIAVHTQLAAAQTQLAAAQAELGTIQTQFAAAQDELVTAHTQLIATQAELSTLRKQQATEPTLLPTPVTTQQEDSDQAAELLVVRKQQAAEQAALQAVRQQLAAVEEQLHEADRHRVESEQRVDELSQQLSQLGQELSHLRTDHEAGQEKLVQLTGEHEQLSQTLSQRDQELSQLQREQERDQERLVQLQSDLEADQEMHLPVVLELTQAKGRLAESLQRCDGLQRQVTQLQERAALDEEDMQQAVAAAEEVAQEAQEEARRLSDQCQRLDHQLCEVQAALTAAEAEAARARQQLSQQLGSRSKPMTPPATSPRVKPATFSAAGSQPPESPGGPHDAHDAHDAAAASGEGTAGHISSTEAALQQQLLLAESRAEALASELQAVTHRLQVFVAVGQEAAEQQLLQQQGAACNGPAGSQEADGVTASAVGEQGAAGSRSAGSGTAEAGATGRPVLVDQALLSFVGLMRDTEVMYGDQGPDRPSVPRVRMLQGQLENLLLSMVDKHLPRNRLLTAINSAATACDLPLTVPPPPPPQQSAATAAQGQMGRAAGQQYGQEPEYGRMVPGLSLNNQGPAAYDGAIHLQHTYESAPLHGERSMDWAMLCDGSTSEAAGTSGGGAGLMLGGGPHDPWGTMSGGGAASTARRAGPVATQGSTFTGATTAGTGEMLGDDLLGDLDGAAWELPESEPPPSFFNFNK